MGRSGCVLLAALWLGAATVAQSAPLILNEYNAVGSLDFLNGGDPNADLDGGLASDSYFGRVMGNGGDWFELVVVADGLDIRGWQLVVCESIGCNAPLVFADQPLWSSLQAGTIITVGEDLPSDVSYDPASGDWWIHVQAANGAPGTYITADNFPVSRDDWQLTILDATGAVVFGPAGEGIAPGVQVNSREVFKLETTPSAVVSEDSEFYDDAVTSSFGSPNTSRGGLASQDFSALRLDLPLPDRDGDGIPDDGDFSGWISDRPCGSEELTDCDDNCSLTPNPEQLDSGGVGTGSPDGRGDDCQCGDATGDDVVTSLDVEAIRRWLAGLDPQPFTPEKCGVVNDGDCTMADVVVITRQLNGYDPALAPVCVAAAGPADPTELMFDPNRVLEVVITLDADDWDELRTTTRTLASFLLGDCYAGPPADIYQFFPGTVSVDGIVLNNVGVRKKGFFGSLDSTRPSLKVDFSEFSSGQRIRGMERLTLNNNKQDPSNVKQCLGYELFRKAGVPAPRCNFAHVTVNGEDLGVYTHVESIKPPFLERHFGDASGNLYEATRSDFRPTWINTFAKKTNVEDPNRGDLQALADALTVPDESLVSALDPVLDRDAYYSFWAMEGIIGHWDGYADDQNNYWVYFAPDTGRAHFLPWGIDGTFAGGNPFAGEGGIAAPAIRPRALLPRRLYLNPATQSEYLARLTALLDTVWDAAELNAEIDRLEVLLAPYGTGFLAHTPAVHAWIDARKDAVLVGELGGGPPAWTAPLPVATCMESLGPFSGTFQTTWGTAESPVVGGLLSLPAPFPAMSLFVSGAGQTASTPPGWGTVFTLGLTPPTLSSGTVLFFQASLPRFQVGSFPIEGFEAGFLAYPSMTFSGVVLDGTYTFSQVGTTPGAAVRGTLTGQVGVFTPAP